MQSLERVRTDSTGSAVSTDDSEQGGHLGAPPGGDGKGVGLAEEAALGRLGMTADAMSTQSVVAYGTDEEVEAWRAVGLSCELPVPP